MVCTPMCIFDSAAFHTVITGAKRLAIILQKGVEILTRDETGGLVGATVKAAVSDSKGKKIGQVSSLSGSGGHYILDLLDLVSSAGLYR